MKICAKCGKENDDASAFCTECGQKFEQTAQTPQYAQPVQPISYSQMMASNPAIKLIRQIGTSPLFLLAVILFSVMVVIQAVSIFMPAADNTSLLNIIFSNRIGSDISNINVFTGLIALIGPVIICIGIWLQYTACNDISSGVIKTSGLSMIRVMTIINFVLYCITLILTFLGSLIIIAFGSEISDAYLNDSSILGLFGAMGYAGTMIGLFVIISVIIAGIFMILYYVKLISTIKSIITTASTGKPETKISMFVIVMNFIIALGSLFFAISQMATVNFILTLPVLINAVFMIVVSVALASYKSKIRIIETQLKNSGNIPQ